MLGNPLSETSANHLRDELIVDSTVDLAIWSMLVEICFFEKKTRGFPETFVRNERSR